MKKTFILTTAGFFLGLMSLKAQTTCSDDRVAYVNSKNTGPIGAYTLSYGHEEKGSQAYHYSGPGKVGGARVFGSVPLGPGVFLKVSLFNVDANDRPTGSALATAPLKDFYAWSPEFFDVSFSPAVSVSANFAVVVEVVHFPGWGHEFELNYTGNGEGNGEDLASLSGTSTGFNWASAKTAFSKDGDFYIYPKMINYNTPMFTIASSCINTGATVAFNNTTQMTTDPMFNLANNVGPNYLYTWDFGDGSPVSHLKNPSHTYATAGEYSVVLTSFIDGWSSDCSKTYSKTISVGLAVSATSVTNATCFGENSGSVIAVGTGGGSPYVYSLNGDSFNSNPTFNGLSAGTRTLFVRDDNGCIQTTSFTIGQPTAIQFTSTTSTNASCGNADGGILVTTIGGISPIQYKLNLGSYGSNNSFTALSSNAYTITAKDANGCTQANMVIVNDLGGPAFNLINSTNVSCFEGNDASITLTSLGGTGAIKYSINGGTTFQSSGVFSNLTAGNYTVVVQDATGCSDIQLVTIEQPQHLAITATSENLSCFESADGQIDVTSVTGGIGSISYSLNGVSFQSGTHFSNLEGGVHTVYARDIAGCVNTISVTLTQPTILSASVSVVDAGCYGSQDGSITVLGTGGTPSYYYGIGTDESFQSSGVFGDLEANSEYLITVKDENGCSYSTTVSVNQPSVVVLSATSTNSTCGNSNGGILALATGGSGSGYTYSKDGGAYGSGSFSALAADVYVISAKDGSGCIGVVNSTVVDSDGPSIVSSTHTNVNCHGGNDGTISVGTVTGGTGTLFYSINGVTFQTSPIFNKLSAGEYEVIVKDIVGCIGYTSISITEPNAFVISNTVNNVLCNGNNTGSISLSVGGGSGTLAYSINNGITYQSSNTFSNLSADFYQMIVKDAGGCLGTTSALITEPHSINAIYSSLKVFCKGDNDGTLNIHASGGVGALQYSLNGTTFQSASEFIGLNGGLYSVSIKDANNCIATIQATVYEPEILTVTGRVTNVTCKGGNNGVIDLSVNGGFPDYEFNWSNESNSEDIFNLAKGDYSVTVNDANGCSASIEFSVNEPILPIIVNGTITNAVNSQNGAIDVTTTGGVGGYSYLWSTSQTTQDLSNLANGVYTVVVTDDNNCSASSTFEVTTTAGISVLEDVNGEFLVYPNPANDYVVIKVDGFNIDKIEVVDPLGKVAFSSEFKDSKVQINTSTFDQGMYFVKIQSNKKEVIKKLRIIK